MELLGPPEVVRVTLFTKICGEYPILRDEYKSLVLCSEELLDEENDVVMLDSESVVMEAKVQVVEEAVAESDDEAVVWSKDEEEVGDEDSSDDDELPLDSVDVGVGVGVGVGDSDEEDEGDVDSLDSPESPLPFPPSVSNTTILAFAPLGTVTTQNVAPPAPVVSLREH